MTTFTKSVIALAFVGAVFGTAAFFNLTPFRTAVQQIVAGSPTGTTYQTAKFFGVTVNLASPGANATSSSIYNGTGNDLYIKSFDAGCESVGTSKTAYTGVGLASLTVTAATSSTAAPAANANTNLAGSVTIATSTAQFAEASTTPVATGSGSINYIWAAGSNMTFTFNATNTAACTVGVEAFSS